MEILFFFNRHTLINCPLLLFRFIRYLLYLISEFISFFNFLQAFLPNFILIFTGNILVKWVHLTQIWCAFMPWNIHELQLGLSKLLTFDTWSILISRIGSGLQSRSVAAQLVAQDFFQPVFFVVVNILQNLFLPMASFGHTCDRRNISKHFAASVRHYPFLVRILRKVLNILMWHHMIYHGAWAATLKICIICHIFSAIICKTCFVDSGSALWGASTLPEASA